MAWSKTTLLLFAFRPGLCSKILRALCDLKQVEKTHQSTVETCTVASKQAHTDTDLQKGKQNEQIEIRFRREF